MDIFGHNNLFLYAAILISIIGLLTYLYFLYTGFKNKNFSKLLKNINIIIFIMIIALILGIIAILIK